MSTIAAQAVQMQAAAFSQQVGTAIARQQIATERSVAQLVAQSASPPAPPGQGQMVDMKV
ncbi:putative motility protein [Methylorubrum sp. SB2]|uniref:putative motility protein n=1 Tax=Methylorubrum subtropicum TaxID=3138812 RepID=UPI00313DC4A2